MKIDSGVYADTCTRFDDYHYSLMESCSEGEQLMQSIGYDPVIDHGAGNRDYWMESQVSTIPEVSTVLMLVAGGLAALLARRKAPE